MNKITGVVYNKHGDIGKFIVGLKDGIHREWFRNGNLKDEITYLNGYKNGDDLSGKMFPTLFEVN